MKELFSIQISPINKFDIQIHCKYEVKKLKDEIISQPLILIKFIYYFQ